MGADPAAVTPGAGFVLAHNVDSPGTVRDVLDRAQRAGATVLKPAQQAAFGGVHGYFADPVGIRWEVAYNPGWRVAPDGNVSLA
ncbi:MAG TPA: VOC family protein [Mycobacteriales bacterium]|nr:VOC family protein [Mycobacteriales bacterium]